MHPPLLGPEGMGKKPRTGGVQWADSCTRSCPAEHWQSTSSKDAAGELDDSPVCRAIARHLGLDISAEGRAAQNRRGIVIIIHGAPLTGTCGVGEPGQGCPGGPWCLAGGLKWADLGSTVHDAAPAFSLTMS